MKVVLAGGGTGGHFYPLIAITEQLNDIADAEHIADAKWYYFSDSPYDQQSLAEQRIAFVHIPSGKLGLSWGFFKKAISAMTTLWGTVRALWKLFVIYPDVVIGKGGYASVPTVLAAAILRIPIIIHESDTVPGRANVLLSRFATNIAITYPSAISYFDASKTACIGQPIRRATLHPIVEGSYEYLALDPQVPTILILGGSSGAQKINDAIIDILPEIVSRYQVIHQVGSQNIEYIQSISETVLMNSEFKQRYRPFGFLNSLAMSMSAGIAGLVITRAGSGLQEVAAWGLPSLVIPITHTNGDHQRKNAYEYAGTGAAIVIEESNLKGHIILSEVDRILQTREIHEEMSQATQAWVRTDAALVIAQRAFEIARSHQ
jgi:UDP-N-acetylglucosamine--N-acetylmuramyl-(pentapeptide) pyrophosphoryl-undecaprenol N-acetylglucosamine transferase